MGRDQATPAEPHLPLMGEASAGGVSELAQPSEG